MLADASDSMIYLFVALVALAQLIPPALAYSRKQLNLAFALLAVMLVVNGFLLWWAAAMFRTKGGEPAAALYAGMAFVVWLLCIIWASYKRPSPAVD